jgi:hypothetical protein
MEAVRATWLGRDGWRRLGARMWSSIAMGEANVWARKAQLGWHWLGDAALTHWVVR